MSNSSHKASHGPPDESCFHAIDFYHRLLDEASIKAAWKRLDATFDDLAAHLDKAGEGNYRITGGVSYSEFELVSWLNMARRASYNEVWKRLASRNRGRWEKLMNLPVYKEILPADRNVAPP